MEVSWPALLITCFARPFPSNREFPGPMVSVPLAGPSSPADDSSGRQPEGRGRSPQGRRSQGGFHGQADFEALPDSIPPQNIEAEEAVLGGILLDPDAIGRVADVLQPEAF